MNNLMKWKMWFHLINSSMCPIFKEHNPSYSTLIYGSLNHLGPICNQMTFQLTTWLALFCNMTPWERISCWLPLYNFLVGIFCKVLNISLQKQKYY